jgi:hypothetical protein
MIGSVANLIVAERAKQAGVTIAFRAYGRISKPIWRGVLCADSEKGFSGMSPIAAGSASCRHLRSAPAHLFAGAPLIVLDDGSRSKADSQRWAYSITSSLAGGSTLAPSA